VIARIAALVQCFNFGIEGRLPLLRSLQHKLNLLHCGRRIASAKILRGR
jgi:hypothetical protein